jgi:hypothetical protein
MEITYKNAVHSPFASEPLCTVPHLLSFVDQAVCAQHQLTVSEFFLRWSPLPDALLTVANYLVPLALPAMLLKWM